MKSSKWPKTLPPLTEEQKRISDDFMRYWHEILPKRKYGIVEKFNQNFPVRHSQSDFVTTLEIGAGLGEHLAYERLTSKQEENYYCNEIRQNMADEIRKRYPKVQTAVGDCQKPMPQFRDGFFDRVLAIHVLEHLPNLPACISEVRRLISASGRFLVVIPCEGGLAYSLARKISAEREYKKRYGGSYKWFYTREHINQPYEIFEELDRHFEIATWSYFPLLVPFTFCNLCIGLDLRPRNIVVRSLIK